VIVAERIRTFSVSSNGVLVYSGGAADDMPLTWMDRNGKRLDTLGEPGQIGWMNFSPDWKRAAVLMIDEGNWDIWTYHVQRGVRTRFTTDPAQEYASAWSPHGDVIVFNSKRKGNWDIYRKAADGSGARRADL
jgi:Tol biopolymer transport system component